MANDVGKLKGRVSNLEEKNRVLEDNYQEEMAELREEIDWNKEMLTAEVTYSASLHGIIARSGEVLAAACRIGICWGGWCSGGLTCSWRLESGNP